MLSDEEWDRQNALRAADAFRAFRQAAQRETQQAREATPFRKRAVQLLVALTTLQHEPAAAIGQSAPSSDAVRLPSMDEGIAWLKSSECTRLVGQMFAGGSEARLDAVRELEAALDSHRGYLRHSTGDIGEEKDGRIVRDFVGWSPSEVVRADRSLGPEAAVRLARARADMDPDTGEMEEPS